MKIFDLFRPLWETNKSHDIKPIHAYWFNMEQRQLIDVTGTYHTEYLLKHPEVFGIDQESDVYKQESSKEISSYNSDLIDTAVGNGWVRLGIIQPSRSDSYEMYAYGKDIKHVHRGVHKVLKTNQVDVIILILETPTNMHILNESQLQMFLKKGVIPRIMNSN